MVTMAMAKLHVQKLTSASQLMGAVLKKIVNARKRVPTQTPALAIRDSPVMVFSALRLTPALALMMTNRSTLATPQGLLAATQAQAPSSALARLRTKLLLTVRAARLSIFATRTLLLTALLSMVRTLLARMVAQARPLVRA
jgi:hypothetical protein